VLGRLRLRTPIENEDEQDQGQPSPIFFPTVSLEHGKDEDMDIAN